VFFIVLTSVLLQGTSIPIVARWLKVDEPLSPRKESSPVWDAPTSLKSGLLEVRIPEHSWSIGQRLLDLGLPKGAFILLIARNGKCFVPDGTTVLQANDSLLAFTDHFSFLRLRSILESRHQPPPSKELPDDRGVEVV
jgi:cell volume regulation protein A